VLAAKIRLKTTPVVGRVSKRQKERAFESANRMARREQVSVKPFWVDDGLIRGRNLHTVL